jgi:8-oxo-dGTP pyrophosphatase MutT (NUDIX family)
VHRFATVILVDRRGWLLLQERDEHPVIAPEKWAMCGGHLEPGEDFLTGAVRELEEETGVRLAPDDLTLFAELEVRHEEYGTVDTLAVYAAATDLSDDDIVLGEGRQIVFVEPAAARALDLSASAERVVPAFLDSELYRTLTD